MARRKRIVVAGTGFAGMRVAEDLSTDHDVVIVSPRPRFTFLPLVHELLSEETTPVAIERAVSEIARATYVQGHGVRVDDHRLETDDGDRIRFDKLVVAIGAEPHYFGILGAKEHALPIWSLENAIAANIQLKRLVLSPPDSGTYRVIVVGAGATGLEVATEVAAFFDRYNRPHEVKVLEMRDDIFPESRTAFRREIRKGLKRYNLDILLETKVERIGAQTVTVRRKGKEPEELSSDLTLWCAGIRGRVLEPLSMEVDWTLRSKDHPDVFIAGDCARFPERVPQLAQTAEAQAEVVAHNIRRPDRMRSYEPKPKGSIISLGPGYAVAEMSGGTVLSGKVPWHIKKQYYKWTLRRK